MKTKVKKETAPRCSECGVKREWRNHDVEMTDNGFTIIARGVPAWVCPMCGEAVLTASIAKEIMPMTQALRFAIKGARPSKPKLKEFVIKLM